MIERIKYLLGLKYQERNKSNEYLNPHELLILSFSNVAIRELKQRIKEDGELTDDISKLSELNINTIDSFVAKILKIQNIPMMKTYDDNIRTGSNFLKFFDFWETNFLSSINHIIIDEMQDIVSPRSEFILTLIQRYLERKTIDDTDFGITIAADKKQAIFHFALRNSLEKMNFFDFINNLHNLIDFHDNKLMKFALDKSYRLNKTLFSPNLTYNCLNRILEDTGYENDEIVKSKIKHLYQNSLDKKSLTEIQTMNGENAILCRTNPLATKISRILIENKIKFSLNKKSNQYKLSPVIAEMVLYYMKNSAGENFEKVLKMFYKDNLDEIKKCFHNNNVDYSSVYGLCLFLSKINKSNTCYSLFTEEIKDNLIISTIHNVKGREFNNVLLVEDELFENKPDNNRILYVGLTRNIDFCYKTGLENNYKHLKKEIIPGSKRLFYNNKLLNQRLFEVGLEDDIDLEFFKLQNYENIEEYSLRQNNLISTDKHSMIKIIYGNYKDKLGLYIYKNDDFVPLAKMSDNFKNEIFGKIFENRLITEYKDISNCFIKTIYTIADCNTGELIYPAIEIHGLCNITLN